MNVISSFNQPASAELLVQLHLEHQALLWAPEFKREAFMGSKDTRLMKRTKIMSREQWLKELERGSWRGEDLRAHKNSLQMLQGHSASFTGHVCSSASLFITSSPVSWHMVPSQKTYLLTGARHCPTLGDPAVDRAPALKEHTFSRYPVRGC